MNGQAGKGDTYRPVDRKKFNDNYDRIFSKKKIVKIKKNVKR